jgi:hypothetical protein
MLLFFGLWISSRRIFSDPVNIYDEGLLLSHAQLLAHGALPFRDFYSSYPPGTYQLLAVIWKVFGESVIAERVLAVLFHLAIAFLAGRLAGRIVGRRLVLLASSAVMLYLAWLPSHAYAWIAALACALGAAELLLVARDRWSRPRALLLGGALGLTGCFRHDLLAYCLICAIPLAAWWLWRANIALERALAATVWIGLGALVPLIPVWAQVLHHVSLHRLAGDLFFEQIRYIQPESALPLPSFIHPSMETWTVVIVLSAPLVAAGLTYRAWRDGHDWLAPVALGIVGLAVLPQALGRSDMTHLVYTVTCGVTQLAALLALPAVYKRRWLISTLSLATVVALAFAYRQHIFNRETREPGAVELRDNPRVYPIRADGVGRRELLDFLAAHVRPDEPIFFALTKHRQVALNEVDLYFIAGHPPATRYLVFAPGVVTRAEVQQEIIEQLEARHVGWVVRSSRFEYLVAQSEKPDAGSDDLDRYIAAHYRPVYAIGPYTVLTHQ